MSTDKEDDREVSPLNASSIQLAVQQLMRKIPSEEMLQVQVEAQRQYAEAVKADAEARKAEAEVDLEAQRAESAAIAANKEVALARISAARDRDAAREATKLSGLTHDGKVDFYYMGVAGFILIAGLGAWLIAGRQEGFDLVKYVGTAILAFMAGRTKRAGSASE